MSAAKNKGFYCKITDLQLCKTDLLQLIFFSNSAKSANPFAVRQSDTFDEDTFIDSNPISVQPPSTSLEESQTSNTTFDDENFFDCTIDVSATSDVIEAKNPFKVENFLAWI